MGFWGRFVEVEGGFAKGLGDRGLGLPIGYVDITGLSRRHNGQVGRDKKNNCFDTSGMVRIGEERTETLKYTPAQLSVKVIVRPKYAKKPEDGEGGSPIAIAELPPRFIDKCIADESLLGAIITDKYVDHIPLYRTAARLARLGVPIPLSTMCGWAGQCASAMRPLFEALVREVLRSGYLQADETRIEVVEKAPKPRGRPKKGKTHRGYLWGYHAVGEKRYAGI
jgi:transposase